MIITAVKKVAGALHGLAKTHSVVSHGLAHYGHPKLAGIAKAVGYGKKKRRRRVAK